MDLSKFVSPELTLGLVNQANDWSYEFGYWGAARIVSESGSCHRMIDIEVDRLTNSIEEVGTGRKLDTSIERATRSDLKGLGPGWKFEWLAELRRHEVYKLVVPELDDEIHGLVSLSREADHVFTHLVENHPLNVGREKRYEGVAGNLFAFAAKLSFELGHQGFVCFVAKTQLIGHYQKKFGAQRMGRGPRMHLDTTAAQTLMRSYFGD